MIPANENRSPPTQPRVAMTMSLWEAVGASELLKGITLATANVEETAGQDNDESSSATCPEIQDLRVSDKMACSTCAVTFKERDEQTDHYKSDWHRFNLKLRLRGDAYVNEDKFEEVNQAGDLSSISGSDSEGDEDRGGETPAPPGGAPPLPTDPDSDPDEVAHIEGIGKRHPRVFLRNHQGELLSIYRCVIHGKKNAPSSQAELLHLAAALPRQMMWAIFMVAGGHFAGAIFDGEKVAAHKTFHRYTTRAKRGTVQSARDNKGNMPHSGGASMRRHHEAALVQEVQELILSWAGQLEACSRIFVRVPAGNQAILFGTKTPPLDKRDPRLRVIPFQTRRPTKRELHRVHQRLACVERYGQNAAITDHIRSSPKKQQQQQQPPSPPPPPAQGGVPPGVREVRRQGSPSPQPVPPAGESDQSNSAEDDDKQSVAMVTDYIVQDLGDLRPFEATKKPRRRKKKPEPRAETAQEESDTAGQPPGGSALTDPRLEELHNDMFTACKTGSVELLQCCLQSPDLARLTRDTRAICQERDLQREEGHATPARSSCAQFEAQSEAQRDEDADRTVLLRVVLNEPIGRQGGLLHVASSGGHREVVALLLEAGADPTIGDGQGRFPYVLASNKETRQEFRRYRARYPDRYDYDKAQIASPLTPEQEADQKAREAERKKMLRKVKKDRLKDRKEDDRKARDEEAERQRYLALSDREKRALAAEKRLTDQRTARGENAPVLSRCFQCAADMTNKVPFEYLDYRFCSPSCLKSHRQGGVGKR